MSKPPVIDKVSAEEMNLSVIKRIDPEVEQVLAAAGHVCLYHMALETQQWVRKNVEGSLFLLKRRREPRFQMMVLNKLTTENYIESVHGGLDFEINAPYLMYTHGNSEIHGIWFYEKTDLDKISSLLERIKSQLPPPISKVEPVGAAASGAGDSFWDKKVDVPAGTVLPPKAGMSAPQQQQQQQAPPPQQQQQQASHQQLPYHQQQPQQPQQQQQQQQHAQQQQQQPQPAAESGGNNLANLLRSAAQKASPAAPPPTGVSGPAHSAGFASMGETPQHRHPQAYNLPAPAAPPPPPPPPPAAQPMQLLSPAHFASGGAAVNKLVADVRKTPALSPAPSADLGGRPVPVAEVQQPVNSLQRLFAKASPAAPAAPLVWPLPVQPAAPHAGPVPESARPFGSVSTVTASAEQQQHHQQQQQQPIPAADASGSQRRAAVRTALTRLLANDAVLDAVIAEFKAVGIAL